MVLLRGRKTGGSIRDRSCCRCCCFCGILRRRRRSKQAREVCEALERRRRSRRRLKLNQLVVPAFRLPSLWPSLSTPQELRMHRRTRKESEVGQFWHSNSQYSSVYPQANTSSLFQPHALSHFHFPDSPSNYALLGALTMEMPS